MRTIKEIKRILAEHKEEIRKRYGVIILGIFGSYVRGEENKTSDVDILVELERPIGLKFFELWDNLENLLGCDVDLVRAKLLRDEISDDVLKEFVEI